MFCGSSMLFISLGKYKKSVRHTLMVLGLWCLRTLSTISQLYRGSIDISNPNKQGSYILCI